MTNLFKTEVLRHLNWMLILAVAHFLILYYMFSLGSAFTNGQSGLLWLLAMLICGGMFGLLQIKLHKRSNDWVYLLHRPLPPARIHTALTLAGGVLLIVTLFIPALLMVVI